MRKIEIENYFMMNQQFADGFIEQGHRHTKKVNPHTIIFTFDNGYISSDIFKRIDYIIDLLTQAYIIKNPVDKVLINIDKRQKNYLNIEVW